MSDKFLQEGCKTIATESFSISVKLELTDVSQGKSKKKIKIFFKSKYGNLIEEVLTPKRSSNTTQALAAHIGDWLINKQRVEFGFAKKIAWAISREFEY